MPHLIGHHVDVALRHIEDLGLRARVLTTEVHDKTDRHVVSTRPAPGTDVSEDRTVEVVIGIAPSSTTTWGATSTRRSRVADRRPRVDSRRRDRPGIGPVRHQDRNQGGAERVRDPAGGRPLRLSAPRNGTLG